jgi:hypothetical protein
VHGEVILALTSIDDLYGTRAAVFEIRRFTHDSIRASAECALSSESVTVRVQTDLQNKLIFSRQSIAHQQRHFRRRIKIRHVNARDVGGSNCVMNESIFVLM